MVFEIKIMRKSKQISTNSELEIKFQQIFNEHHNQIQEKLSQASQLIEEAVEISEKYGLPFRPQEDIMWMTPSYIPESFNGKFPNLDYEFWTNLTDACGDFDDEIGFTGWQQSQVC